MIVNSEIRRRHRCGARDTRPADSQTLFEFRRRVESKRTVSCLRDRGCQMGCSGIYKLLLNDSNQPSFAPYQSLSLMIFSCLVLDDCSVSQREITLQSGPGDSRLSLVRQLFNMCYCRKLLCRCYYFLPATKLNSCPSYSFSGRLERHMHDSFQRARAYLPSIPATALHSARRRVHYRVTVWASAHHRPAALAYPTFFELRSPIEAVYGFFFM